MRLWATRIWGCTRCAAGRGTPSTGSAHGTSWARTPRSTKCCCASAEQQLYDTARDLLPGAIELDDTVLAHRVPVLAGGHDLRRHRRGAAQHHRAPAARASEGVDVDRQQIDLQLLQPRRCARSHVDASGAELDAALRRAGLGSTCSSEMPDAGNTSGVPVCSAKQVAHAPVLNDVVLRPQAAARAPAAAVRRRTAGWCGSAPMNTDTALGDELPHPPVSAGDHGARCGRGMRRALGWWLVGAASSDAGAGTPTCVGPVAIRQARSRRSRRSGTGWPRRWSPSKAPKRR